MSRILIANQDTTFLNALKEHLAALHEVKTCSDGRKVLELCQQSTPDLLVIDLEMPYLDGISTLHLLHDSGHDPDVLVISGCLFSGYVTQTLTRMGISFMLPKPCTIEAASAMVCEIVGLGSGCELDGNEEIERLLLMLGLLPNLNGHKYLNMAISLVRDDPTLQVTKTVYPVIAEKFHVSDSSVERAIRSSIRSAWKRRNQGVWSMFFPLDRDGTMPCPTNSQFICRLAVCFEKRKIG